MSTNGAFVDGTQFMWDATSISTAQTCLRKYYYSMIEGWKPLHESYHLRFGKHYADALEHYYKHRALGLDKHEALRLVIREAMENTWDRSDDHSGPWLSPDTAKTRENLIRTIIWYCAQFEDEAIKVVTLDGGKPAVELTFKIPVDNGIIFSGHIDRLVEYSGDIYPMDQKTTAQTISPKFFDQFKPNTQMSMYTFAGKAGWQIPIKGIIIDGAQIAVGFTRFERGFTFRTDPELDEWYNDTLFWIATAQHASREHHFPMNPASCGNYGGCEYRTVCSRAPSVRESFLRASFKKTTPWDPSITR